MGVDQVYFAHKLIVSYSVKVGRDLGSSHKPLLSLGKISYNPTLSPTSAAPLVECIVHAMGVGYGDQTATET